MLGTVIGCNKLVAEVCSTLCGSLLTGMVPVLAMCSDETVVFSKVDKEVVTLSLVRTEVTRAGSTTLVTFGKDKRGVWSIRMEVVTGDVVAVAMILTVTPGDIGGIVSVVGT